MGRALKLPRWGGLSFFFSGVGIAIYAYSVLLSLLLRSVLIASAGCCLFFPASLPLLWLVCAHDRSPLKAPGAACRERARAILP